MPKAGGEMYRNIRLCVDSYENGAMTGRYYHPGLETEGRSFKSLSQFLIGMETVLDEMNFPQAFTAKRSFAPLPHDAVDAAVAQGSMTGEKATFTIRLLFRQHASWQGSVTWHEGEGEQTFRSVLELVILLDSALGGCE